MIAVLLAAVGAVVLPMIYLGSVRAERRRRGGLFADCLSTFDGYRVTQEGMHFPVLEGTYRGLPVRLEAVLDDLGVRKLPSLWLKATLLARDPDRGVLGFLVRPQGIEFYSPSHELPRRLAVPATWPQHAILCTDATGKPPDVATLTPHIRAFDDPRMKELVVTPLGVRLVYQAAQAARSEYLVLRQARFDESRISPALVKGLLDRAIAIATTLDSARRDHLAQAA